MGNFDVKQMLEKWTILADTLNLTDSAEDIFIGLFNSYERNQVLQELEGKELNHIWKADAYRKECEELDKWW